MSSNVVYAIVKAGGRQEKVSVGDVVVVDKLDAEAGDSVSFAPVMIVDGDQVVSDPAALADKTVSGEVLAQTKGPKIRILKYKNKTGYRKRQGHRAQLTEVKITSIA
ncbi:50S ribosomal protein L21 [Nanchangia anserum]|uniref:Large ribosomal subunit protein bL21 n=1 Tax=Nanchangia anserum TaxID=2692125 RepID=A0A8I0GDD9_9ACTO|nr:50S ribosomal protein L21 [Nanchangia anserum]MBD3690196.1 50S ribosomal protein L21 [Nanchangia anserum]QOX82351.1 50S ribosomal protein L21 [Nanchangia anserum]